MDLVCILDNVQIIVVMDSIWYLGWYPFTNAGSPIPKSGLSRLLDPMSASLPVIQGAGITRVLHRYSMVQIVQHCTLNHQHCTHTGYRYILPIEVWLLHKTAGCYILSRTGFPIWLKSNKVEIGQERTFKQKLSGWAVVKERRLRRVFPQERRWTPIGT